MTDLQSKLQHLNIHRSLTGQWKNKKQKDNYLSKNSEATKQKKKKRISNYHLEICTSLAIKDMQILKFL